MYCFIGGTPEKHGALERCFPVGLYRGIDPTVLSSVHTAVVCAHSVSVCPHSGCLCCEEEEGGAALINMGP